MIVQIVFEEKSDKQKSISYIYNSMRLKPVRSSLSISLALSPICLPGKQIFVIFFVSDREGSKVISCADLKRHGLVESCRHLQAMSHLTSIDISNAQRGTTVKTSPVDQSGVWTGNPTAITIDRKDR